MPKYLIDIPDGSDTEYAYDQDTKELKFPSPRIDTTSFMGLEIVLTNVVPYTKDEVWELIKDINYLGYDDFVTCFNGMTEEQIFELSYQEAKEKYEAWKKSKDKIRVGDEVIDKDVGKAIVTYIDFELCNTLWLDGSVSEDVPLKDLHKTGRHFDEVEELLKKMREEE